MPDEKQYSFDITLGAKASDCKVMLNGKEIHNVRSVHISQDTKSHQPLVDLVLAATEVHVHGLGDAAAHLEVASLRLRGQDDDATR